MRTLALPVLAAVMLAAGCGDGGTSSSSTTTLAITTTTTLPPLDCPDPVVVSSTEDLVAALAALPWEGAGAYTSGPLPITPDLVVSGTVVLEAGQLPIPATCLGRSDCSPRGGFWAGSVAGVVVEGHADVTCLSAASRLTLTGTTVRLRPLLSDTHPCAFNYVPVVQVKPPCGTPCSSDQAMCPADGVCYARGTTYCQSCEGGSKEACACRGPGGPLEEGASCSYWESGDVRCDGICRQGTCDAGSCP
jgi:hypothetical protein